MSSTGPVLGAARRSATGELTDEQLVARVRTGDGDAVDELLDRYRGFARYKASAYFLRGGDRDDVVQEGMIGLYKAIRDFDADRGAAFRTFAELCITRQILTAIKAATRQKHAPLNTYVSFDQPTSSGSGLSLEETLGRPEDATDPLHRLVSSDTLRRLEELVGSLLSDLEADVLDLYVAGHSYKEIADAVGRHVKAVDNAIQRAKRKLEEHLPDPA